MNPDDIIAKLAQLKKEPAPEYVYDENGLGHKAIMLQRETALREIRDLNPIDDELPEHSAPLRMK